MWNLDRDLIKKTRCFSIGFAILMVLETAYQMLMHLGILVYVYCIICDPIANINFQDDLRLINGVPHYETYTGACEI